MANTRDPVCTSEDIAYWKRQINPDTGKHYNQNEIAAMYRTTKQNISYIWRKDKSRPRTPREIVLEHYPWNNGERFHTAMPNIHMRNHAEFMATNGKGMSERKLQRLLWFYQFLDRENVVVEFDPNIPPQEGVSSVGGFAYRPRKASDGNLIIRKNEYTTLTDEGEDLWRFPDEWPQVR